MGGYLILYTKKQLVPQFLTVSTAKGGKRGGCLTYYPKKTVSTAKGVGVSSEKYPKLHLVDVMSDTWYPILPRLYTQECRLRKLSKDPECRLRNVDSGIYT